MRAERADNRGKKLEESREQRRASREQRAEVSLPSGEFTCFGESKDSKTAREYGSTRAIEQRVESREQRAESSSPPCEFPCFGETELMCHLPK